MSAAAPDAAAAPPPKARCRVVSLLPSATELVAAVGAELVGRSHECDFPPDVVAGVPVLTGAVNVFKDSQSMHDATCELLESGQGLYTLDAALLERLAPDVVVTQSLCAVCSVDLSLVARAIGGLSPAPTVISLNPSSLDDVLDDLQRVGDAAGRGDVAAAAVAALRARVNAVEARVAELRAARGGGDADRAPGPRVGFMEWTQPIFPGGHWTPELVIRAGGSHPLNAAHVPSVAVTNDAFVASDPDWIVVCPCGLDIDETLVEMRVITAQSWWGELRAVREGRVALVDGNQFFSRPGPRLVDGLEFFCGLLNDAHELIPPGFAWTMFHPGMEQPRQDEKGEEKGEEKGQERDQQQQGGAVVATDGGGDVAVAAA